MSDFDNNVSFEKRMYGALLRHKRMETGYRKVDEFVEDLNAIGCSISKAALYRIERGEQEPPIGFWLASNLVLQGDIGSLDLVKPCIPLDWVDPVSSDEAMRILKKNRLLHRVLAPDACEESKADRYDAIMSGLNSYDFEVFPNGNCDEDHLYITVATGYDFASEEFDDLESFEITDPEDIERAVISFLKRHAYQLDGAEVEKLVNHAERKVMPALAQYIEGRKSV